MSRWPRRLFIANRGEICRRIAVTAKRLGIETVIASADDHLALYLAEVVTASDPGAMIDGVHVDVDEVLAADFGQWDLGR